MNNNFAPLASATTLVSTAGGALIKKVRRNKNEKYAAALSTNTEANAYALAIVKQRLEDGVYTSCAQMMADQENEIKNFKKGI